MGSGYRPDLFDDPFQNWTQIQCADLQLDLAGIQLTPVEQVFNQTHLGLRVAVDHFQRREALIISALSQDKRGANDSRQRRPQFVDGLRGEFLFPALRFARGFPLVNTLDGEAGLRGNQVQQCNIVVRKRTCLVKLKHDFSRKISARVDWNDEILSPAALSYMAIRYQVLGLGERDERSIGFENRLNLI